MFANPVIGAADAESNATLFGLPVPRSAAAQAAAVYEVSTGQLLGGYNLDAVRAPASLTKVAAMHVLLEAARNGEFDLDRMYPVPEPAFHFNVPRGSSLMFLGPDQIVDGHTLLQGLAVASGNDAAVAAGILVAGSVDRFVGRMNNVMQRMGLEQTRFVEPSGLSPANQTTAREFGRFTVRFLREWPEALPRYVAIPQFAYPQRRNVTINRPVQPIVQANRNGLLSSYPGADGLKTGYIEESGYNLAATALRDGRRIVAVILGVEAESPIAAARIRTQHAAALLDWAFGRTALVQLEAPQIPPITVWEGRLRQVELRGGVLNVTIPAGAEARLSGTLDLPPSLTAPFDRRTQVGVARFSLDGYEVGTIPLYPAEDGERAALPRRLWHRFVRWIERVISGIALAFERAGEPALAEYATHVV